MMSNLLPLAWSSIGKKVLLGLTGFGLCLFAVGHLVGNFLIFKGAGAFNGYGALLENSGSFLIIVELGLLATFVLHLVLAVVLTLENRGARPEPYAVYKSKEGRTVASATMIYTGLIVLIFIIVHLADLKYGVENLNPAGQRDLYGGVIELFQRPVYMLGYVFAVCVLGLHVSHGLQSGFRSLGFHHSRYTPWLEKLSIVFGLVVALGYSSIPVWVYFCKGGAS